MSTFSKRGRNRAREGPRGHDQGTQAQAGRQQPGQIPPAAQVTPFEAAGGSRSPRTRLKRARHRGIPADYQNLSQVIRQLDKRRRQVYVEAMIIEASLIN